MLALVLVSLGLAAWVRLPVHWRRQLLRNESIAIGTMKRLSEAILMYMANHGPTNEDAAAEWKPPEFPVMAALDLLEPARTGRLHSPILLEAEGYMFELWLSELDLRVDYKWACYAWPVDYGWSGVRAFFINHHGDVLSTNNHPTHYSGLGHRPDPATAAFKLPARSPAAQPVINANSMTGLRWTVI